MNISFVSDAIWPYNKGGKEKRLFDLTTRLAKKYDVHIFTMKWWNGPNRIKKDGVNLHAISSLHPLYSGSRRSMRQAILFGLSCFRLLMETWDVIDVDHMPFFPLFTTKIVCLIKGKKLIATWHEVWGEQYWKKYIGNYGRIAYLIEKLSVSLPDIIISVSQMTTTNLIKIMNCRKTIFTIPDGIDVQHISKIIPSKIHTDIIFVGRLLAHKNVDFLLHSIGLLQKRLPNIKCAIVGTGPERHNLKLLTLKLELQRNIEFIKYSENHDDILARVKSSKIFAFPSDREGFGIVVLESLACNTPVITINYANNAARHLISIGENGDISEPDVKLFSEAMYRHIQHPYRIKTSTGIHMYDWDHICDKLSAVYLKANV